MNETEEKFSLHLPQKTKINHVMSKESTNTGETVAKKETHSVDYMEQYTADLVDAVRKGAGGVGELQLFVEVDMSTQSSLHDRFELKKLTVCS